MGTTLKSESQVQEIKMEKSNEKPSIITISKKEASSEKRSFWHINKGTLSFKMHFFFFIGGMGASLPFQSVLGITRFGLTASNLAAAYTTQQVLFILFKPAIGYIADYFNRLKATIIGLTIIHAVFYFFMIIIPETDVQGITQSYESNKSINDPYNCLVCDFYHDFSTITANLSVEEETIIRTSLQHTENVEAESIELQCFQKNNLHAPNLDIHLLYATCNDSFFKDLLLSDNFSMQSDGSLVNILYINQTLDGKVTSSLACISPKRMSLIEIYSDNFLSEYCRHISVFPKLTENFHKSQPKVEKCLSSTSFVDETDRMAALSAANFKTYQFWVFSFCLIVSCMSASSIFTISDTACYESIQGADYGRQRAWGAISWGIIAPLAGFLNDYMDSYMAAWCVMVVLLLLQIWNLSKMDLVKPDFSGSILKDIKKIHSSLEFLAFEAGVLMNGMFTGVIWFYLAWFLTSIGGNKLVVGLAHTVQCYAGEVPAMFVSGWMIKKFGHFNIVSLALIGHGIRFFAYSYIHNAWLVLPLECLHGLTFGSFYSAMTSYGKLNSKPGTEATTQAVLCTTYEALGAGLGCLIAGICFDHFGISRTFYFASYLCVLTTLINVIFTIVVNCRQGVLNVTKSTVNERY